MTEDAAALFGCRADEEFTGAELLDAGGVARGAAVGGNVEGDGLSGKGGDEREEGEERCWVHGRKNRKVGQN